ncbi:MAG: ATP synthase F1 subunit delta [Prolixibacteraceae bacterium]|jgi:F-type H+-transporting ATPase subunit delta|nr:ATP synthase F1 subunit delta [Prolixibacteraceae bacterium]MBT6006995.1 ATP synthase F1 subunit delta [Prolixibacteraceae bacterium]MBT6763153.1 ATP synthase F1 subunit delta [Prolixibacteraceae bacterium]MBT6998973.1 ATP synthase F1 subunit delta [Prolixibacteraceae bacterium]MBT7393922.1 ATP synthase F1 subunit delta [Prolixibacteraceae bacterium]
MDHSAIAVRYAKAFFSLAKEKNRLKTLKTDIELIANVCENSADFNRLLESPIIGTSKKVKLLTDIFKGRVDGLTLKFISLITRNKREVHIPGICRNFVNLLRKDQNIKSAIITTATEIDSETIKKIIALVETELETKIEISSNINPEIIGGMVLRLDDKQYDASVATQLKKVKQELLETELEI